MSNHGPLPRYSLEHREQAKQEKRPLFTLDIYDYPRKRRSTTTGVATDSEIDDMIARLRMVKAQKWS